MIPKLIATIDTWDPHRETMPIHAWLHPWLPLLGHHIEPLYPTIHYKLGNTLHGQHANDASTYAILSPSKTIFDPASQKQLIVYFIVPNLITIL